MLIRIAKNYVQSSEVVAMFALDEMHVHVQMRDGGAFQICSHLEGKTSEQHLDELASLVNSANTDSVSVEFGDGEAPIDEPVNGESETAEGWEAHRGRDPYPHLHLHASDLEGHRVDASETSEEAELTIVSGGQSFTQAQWDAVRQFAEDYHRGASEAERNLDRHGTQPGDAAPESSDSLAERFGGGVLDADYSRGQWMVSASSVDKLVRGILAKNGGTRSSFNLGRDIFRALGFEVWF